MESFVSTFSQQLRHATEIGAAADLQALASYQPRHVVVAGLGGSGIGADVVRGILFDRLTVPLTVVRTYAVPAFVGPDTLFIASSFSGDTEETLAAVDAAHARGAQIVAVTSGGGLKARAMRFGWPTILIPGESGLPRANVGYSLVQLLFILRAAGLLPDDAFRQELTEATDLLDAAPEAMQQEAHTLANALTNHLPIIYADARLEGVAMRFRQQLNENANQLALVNTFSEMNHNEIVGWENPADVLSRAAVVMLRTPLDHPRVALRMELCAPMFAAHAASVQMVEARGTSALAQAIYLINLLDWVSVFVARLNGADPLTVPAIDELKARLAARG